MMSVKGFYPALFITLNLIKMKKLLILLIVVCTSMVGNRVYAQFSNKTSAPDAENDFAPSSRNLAILQNHDLRGAYILSRNEINLWATRDFLTRFDMVDNVVWFAGPKGGSEAYFVRDGLGQRVIYDESGGWELSLITYKEDKLPHDIRTAVRSANPDFEISFVEEVHNYEGFEHIIFLESKSMIRQVTVNRDGTMEVSQDLHK
jgi:hypothetical protein